MIEAVIKALVTIGVVVLVVVVAIWALGEFGLVIPANIVNILFVIGILLALLYLYRALKAGGATWLP